jgi:hypothetical protein
LEFPRLLSVVDEEILGSCIISIFLFFPFLSLIFFSVFVFRSYLLGDSPTLFCIGLLHCFCFIALFFHLQFYQSFIGFIISLALGFSYGFEFVHGVNFILL